MPAAILSFRFSSYSVRKPEGFTSSWQKYSSKIKSTLGKENTETTHTHTKEKQVIFTGDLKIFI